MARKVVKADEGQPIDASARLRLPYARLLIPEDGGGYRAEIMEFPGCIAEGDDAAEALSELEAVAEDWIEAAMEMGSPIPRPLEETDYSGRLNVRLPKSLHRQASMAADLDGVSLNQFIVASVARYIGQKAAPRPQVVVLGGSGTRGVQMVSNVEAPVWSQGSISFDSPHMITNFGQFETWAPPMQELQHADR